MYFAFTRYTRLVARAIEISVFVRSVEFGRFRSTSPTRLRFVYKGKSGLDRSFRTERSRRVDRKLSNKKVLNRVFLN